MGTRQVVAAIAWGVAAAAIGTIPMAIWNRSPVVPLVTGMASVALGLKCQRSTREAIEAYIEETDYRLLARENQQVVARRSLFPEEIPQLITSGGQERILLLLLKNWGIEADYLGKSQAPSFNRIRIRLRRSATLMQIERRLFDLQQGMGLMLPPMIGVDPDMEAIAVDLPRVDRQYIPLESLIKFDRAVADTIKVAIGIDLNGRLIEADLNDPNTCHFLIAGTTGSGKTELLKTMLISIIARYSPESVRLVIVDPKRVTFPQFKNLPWLLSDIAKDEAIALVFLEAVEQEMRRRYEFMEAAGFDNFGDLNNWLRANKKQPLARIVIAIDEYADFMLDKRVRHEFEQLIKPIASMARAAGINLILATQRPSADVVTPLIRSNLPCRIALKTATIQDSQIVLGGEDQSAAYLMGKGDLFLQAGGNKYRLQSTYFNQSLSAYLGDLPQFPTNLLKVEPTVIKPAAPSTNSKGAEIPIATYKQYRIEGKSPDAFLREVLGVSGGNPYKLAKIQLWKAIEADLKNWDLPEADADAIRFVWNLRLTKANGAEYAHKLELLKQIRGQLAIDRSQSP